VSGWQEVCRLDQVPVERGVCALLSGEQVALFRLPNGDLFAVGNLDPFSGAMVLARGIVGSRGDAATVASPMYKQVFDLRTGVCLDNPEVAIPSYPIRVRDGVIEVALAAAHRQPA